MAGVIVKRWLRRSPIGSLLERANSAVQAARQARAVRRRRAREQRTATACGVTLPEGEPLRLALRDRLANRARAAGWPKRLGELELFVVYPGGSWEHHMPAGLAALGRVRTFDWIARGFQTDSAAAWLDGTRDAMNRALLTAVREAHAARPIDAVITYVSGWTCDPATLRAIAALGPAVLNLCLDDTLTFPGPVRGGRHTSTAALADAVDMHLTSDPGARLAYRLAAKRDPAGGLATFHPEAGNPIAHRPPPSWRPEDGGPAGFDHDVSFVGANYGWRARFLHVVERHLAADGVRIARFGRGFAREGEAGADPGGGPLSDEAMVEVFARSRVNVGFSNIGHTRRVCHLKGRDFECPMSGGLYLTQHHDVLRRVYMLEGEVPEILTWRTPRDCADAIRRVLADPGWAAAVRRAGRARALRDHTYAVRFAAPLRLAGILDEDDEHDGPSDGS